MRSGRGAPGWWGRRSLRLRLTVAATALVAVGLALAAALLAVRLDAALRAELDDAASRLARDVAARIDPAAPSMLLGDTGDAVVQVVDGAGRVLAGSANVAGSGPLFAVPAAPPGADPTAVVVADVPVGGTRGSYLVVSVAAGDLSVHVGLPTDDVSTTISELLATLTAGLPVAVGGFGLLAWLLVGRALRPVEAMRLQAADIPVTDLHRRLPLPPTRDEVHRLGRTLNDLLARLDRAADRQRQFIADAAHELRSPLAALRAQVEVAAAHPDRADWPRLAPELLDDLDRLGRLVDDLVRLARLDAAPALRREAVDLDDVVLAAVRRARAGSRVPIRTSGIGAGRVLGDRDGLEHVVANLLDNAARHAASVVAVRVDATGRHVDLVVADDGPGIPQADRERVFERFVRLDTARSRAAPGGAGLGLALVATLAAAHGGRAWVEDNRPGARVHVRFPAGG